MLISGRYLRWYILLADNNRWLHAVTYRRLPVSFLVFHIIIKIKLR